MSLSRVSAAVGLSLPHGDHAHRFDFGAAGPHPPEIKLDCVACRRAVRSLSLDHSGSVVVLGSYSPAPGFGSIQPGKAAKLRAADCFDASPGGWNSDRLPSHYLFVCRHKSGGILSRPVKSETLLARYLDAVCAGASSIVLD